jgi:acyl-CoA thioester hydrolase
LTLPIYKKSFKVPESAIDHMGHVNNLVYLEWCLAIAKEHWCHAAPSNLRDRYIWYVLHHSIDYRNASFPGEDLTLETWVTSTEGVRSERRYLITRSTDGKTIIEASTLWCLLDAKTQKPTKITDEIRNLFQ